MALPGLLIEYLVNGSIALAWLYPLLATHFENVNVVLLPFVVVALYIVGMVIDVVAWAITRPAKHWIRQHVHRKYSESGDPKSVSGTLRQAKITLHAPELGRELAMRSSRDRIARGAIVNAVLAASLVLPWWLGLSLIIASIVMWGMFEKLSYMFELCAEKVVDEQIQMKGGQ
jgi:hypothetical protein